MRTVLIGAVESTRSALRGMAAAGRPPSLLVTLPAERSARHSDYADLAAEARALGVAVHADPDANSDATLERVRAAEADHVLVIGWSQVCRPPLLAATPGGAIGYHPSPLPLMRGRAAIPWAILSGQTETGGSFFWLDDGVDSGPILLQRTWPLSPDATAATLYAEHARFIEGAMPAVLGALASNDPPREPQDHALATFCAKRTAEDGLIDWRAPAREVHRLVRACGSPYPGAFTHWRGRKLVVEATEIHQESWRYVGLAGQVQATGGGRLVVRCGDGGCLTLTAWRLEGEGRGEQGARAAGPSAPRLHDKFEG